MIRGIACWKKAPMPGIPVAKPDAIGLDPERLKRADALVEQWVKTDRIPAAGWCMLRRGRMIEPRLVGRHRPDKDSPSLRRDALFLIASITKPVTATAVMMLLARGQIAPGGRVAGYCPAVAPHGKSGGQGPPLPPHTPRLPAMLPPNTAPRR